MLWYIVLKESAQYQISGQSAREILASVETAIADGELATGQQLPTVRELALTLAVSPATVASAYRELRSRGIAVGDGRRGTRIRDVPALAARPGLVVPAGMRNLASGDPDPALLPRLPAIEPRQRLYGESAVAPELARLARAQFTADGIDAAHLAVVGGALDGVERVLSAWLRVGDRVAVEDPGYGAILDLLAAMGLQAVPVALDEAGALPDELERALRGASAFVTTPRAQNPTGAAWDAVRAAELSRVLQSCPEVLLIEDDHAGPIAGASAHTISPGRARWAVVRSMSKSLGPDLRLALLAGDSATVARLQGRQALGTGWVSHVLQGLVVALLSAPRTGSLLARAADAYTTRRLGLIDALAEHGIEASGRSGLNVWVPVREEHVVTAGLLQGGWAVAPGERFRLASPSAVRIGSATLSESDTTRVAADLAACLRSQPLRTG
jgi:DNA-binding transcriptional MocR family regulator